MGLYCGPKCEDIVRGGLDVKRLPDGYPYKETIVNTVLEEQTVRTSKTNPLPVPFPVKIESGTDYKVIWDGKSYTVTAGAIEDMTAIGNISLLIGSVTDTGEPFLIWGKSEDEMYILSSSYSSKHKVGIVTESETVHTMAPEFLPEGGSGGSGGVFKINVTKGDDSNLVADKTYEEAVAAYNAGNVLFAVLSIGSTDYVFTLSQYVPDNHFLFGSSFTVSGNPTNLYLQLRSDDDVMAIE